MFFLKARTEEAHIAIIVPGKPQSQAVSSSSLLLSSLGLSDTQSMRLKFEPALEPLHIYVKKVFLD